MTPKEKMTKARANLVMGHPFFGALALRLKMAPSNLIDTACIDGRTIYYNEKFVEKLSGNQCIGLIAHEVMHTAFLHHTRRQSRKPMRWNQSCDYAINPILSNSNFELPPDGLNDPKYKDMPAEQIYNMLPDIPGDGQHLVILIGSDGSGALGPDPGKCGGVGDSKAKTAGEIKEEESDWKIAVAQAAHVAKQQGKLPAGLERMIDDLMEAVLPWPDILRRFMSERDTSQFTWSRPNRRLVSTGTYLPARLDEDSMGEMVVAIDTSGSIGDVELREFGSELAGIHKDVKPSKTHVVYCDAAVAHVDTFSREDEVVVKPHGGGGTDFRPVFEWVEEHVQNVRALVYLTDGYGTFDTNPPANYPVLWCINNNQVIPPWGEHLVIDEKE